MEKKNATFMVIITIVAVVIGILGGYIINDMIKESKNNFTDNSSNNNDGNNFQQKNDDIKKLMEKYYDSSEREFITDLSNESVKNDLVFAEIKLPQTQYKTINCDVVKQESAGFQYDSMFESSLTESCLEYDNELPFFDYNEVLSTKKSLFGSGATLNKETFDYGLSIYYFSKNNGFVRLQKPFGTGVPSDIHGSEILNYNDSDTELKVVAYFYDMQPVEDKNLEIIAYNLKTYSGIKIINESESDKVYEIMKNYIDELPKYEYTFKKENGNYYLTDINKVNN